MENVTHGWDLSSFKSLADWSLELSVVWKLVSLDKTLGKYWKTMDDLSEKIEALVQMSSNLEEANLVFVAATVKAKGKKIVAEVKETEEVMLYDLAVSNFFIC
jgi:hypothetical protein